jgi:2-polyprenyl-6-methoxyphenol hydroxylase-like FAD-dependent oxidoreductase
MLGYLLARASVSVVVLEKHADFFRDFRGDTVHPSTLEVIYELGLLDDFLKVPHQKLTSTGGVFGGYQFQAADFRHLPTRCKFVALMPQWDFLDFLSAQAKRFPLFQLRMDHEAIGLLREAGQIHGVKARTPDGSVQIRADLVVGCDGRHSITRQAGQLEVREAGVPIDVLWFRISRNDGDPEQLLGNVNYSKALVLIDRGDYFQAGFVIRKGAFVDMKRRGLRAFRDSVAEVAPYLRDRTNELRDWDQIKLLSVQINRLTQWHRPGLLCIGDAAHAMSPVGGVGINLAIQDAVAAANLLTRPLREKRLTNALLAQVQRRRMFPTRVTQRLQIIAHKGLQKVFDHPGALSAPWQMKAVLRVPGVQRAAGYLIGVGVRPEHIEDRPQRSAVDWFSLKGMAISAGVAAAVAVMALRALRTTEPCSPAVPVRS